MADKLIDPNTDNLWKLIARESLCRGSGLPYLMLPSRSNLKWLVPLANSDVAWRSLDLYEPAHISGIFYKWFLRCLTKISPLLKYQIIFLDKDHKTSLANYIDSMELSCDEKKIAISRGTISARGKNTLQIMDGVGKPLAYLKVAKTPLARDALQREADMLIHLKEKSIVDVVPKILGLFEADGNLVLAQTAGPHLNYGNVFDSQHWDFLHILLEEEKIGFPEDFIIQQNWIRRLQKIEGSIPASQIRVLSQTLAIMLVTPIKLIRQCSIHGDFVPWNIHYFKKNNKNLLFVFDWEHGIRHGIPLFDACHFVVQLGILVRGWDAGKALRQLKLLLSTGRCKTYLEMAEVDDNYILLIISAYLFEVLLDGIEIGEYPQNSLLQKKRILCLELLLIELMASEAQHRYHKGLGIS